MTDDFSAAEIPIDPEAGSNNMATIRARAEKIADKIQEARLTPLEIGYTTVFVSLLEVANQIRHIASIELSQSQLLELATRLDVLAQYAIELGEIETEKDRLG